MNWKTWFYKLGQCVIGGVAATGSAWLGLAVGDSIGLEMPVLNWKALGVILAVSTLSNLFFFLKQSPLPKWDKEQAASRVVMGIAIGAAFVALLVSTSGCGKATLEQGGVYEGDKILYTADATFKVAHATMDFLFKYEEDNRKMLWQVNPSIKRTLDYLRPLAVSAETDYAQARAAYLVYPDQDATTKLHIALAKVEQFATMVQAAMNPNPTPNN